MRFLSFTLAVLASVAAAQEPVRYTVRFPAPQSNSLEIEASFPTEGRPTIELFLPVWTPGSYLVREYARQVEAFKADGGKLSWHKTRKNRWQVETGGAALVIVSYRVFAHDPAVQGNWVDAGFAMLNGAANFMTLVGGTNRPHEVNIVLPPSWKLSISGMKGDGNHYAAADYDELVDSPIYTGNAHVYPFDVAGKKHFLVNEGEAGVWDGPASARDVQKIVEEYARMWGGLPYEKYVFFNMLVESGGGLEHKTSTWMNSSHWAWRNTQEPAPRNESGAAAPPPSGPTRAGWLGLVAHEYFHTWNVKRLRPIELGPFDYENEVYTRSLWIAEGVTSYYGPLALRRAGLTTREQFLRSLSSTIGQLQRVPGRLALPVESASFDAWIKLYRPDENTNNTAISYYTKGDVLGFLLDAKIRKATGGAKSLDDVMTTAYARYSGSRGYTPEDFRRVANEVAGADLGPWFHQVLETTEELEYSEALDWFGLRFRPATQRELSGDQGLTTRVDNGRLVVTQVRRGTPAAAAGFNVNDEILALGDLRVRPEVFSQRMGLYKAGETISVLIARRDQLQRLELTLSKTPRESWDLEVRTDATEEQKVRLIKWLRQ